MTNPGSMLKKKKKDTTSSTKVCIVKAMVFSSHVQMDVRAEQLKRLNTEELVLSNCGAGEDSWESLGQQGDQTSQS